MSSKSEALELIILAASTTMRQSVFASCRKKKLVKSCKTISEISVTLFIMFVVISRHKLCQRYIFLDKIYSSSFTQDIKIFIFIMLAKS